MGPLGSGRISIAPEGRNTHLKVSIRGLKHVVLKTATWCAQHVAHPYQALGKLGLAGLANMVM